MKALYLSTLLIAIFLSACADPAANKPKAVTTDPSGKNSGPVFEGYTAKGVEYEIIPQTSKISFTGSKVTGSHEGGFNTFRGVIDMVDGKPEASRVLIEIDVESVYTDSEGLTKHLKEPDFFDVKGHPKASFISTEITNPVSDGGYHQVTGDFEIRGVRRSISFPAMIQVEPETIAVRANFAINRKDFEIMYAGKADDLIRDDVALRLDIRAAKK